MPNVTLSIETEVLKKAKRRAKAECRSLSQQVTYLIQRDTESRRAARNQQKTEEAA